MSYKILKTISMELSASSINAAIREVKLFQKQLKETMNELVQKLMQEGVEIAKMQVVSMDAFDTGYLESSIHKGLFIPEWGVGWVVVDAPYAVFVEYGTGVVGAEDGHTGIGDHDWNDPIVSMNGKVYAGYDSQGHGEAGWFYIDDRDGKRKWTKGYVSRPFMYNTMRWLEEVAPERTSEMWNQM